MRCLRWVDFDRSASGRRPRKPEIRPAAGLGRFRAGNFRWSGSLSGRSQRLRYRLSLTQSIRRFRVGSPDWLAVDGDFHGARAHRNAEMAEWVFVHNDRGGLPLEQLRHRRDGRGIKPRKWQGDQSVLLRQKNAPHGDDGWCEFATSADPAAVAARALERLNRSIPSYPIMRRPTANLEEKHEPRVATSDRADRAWSKHL
jgi:hypothetical protein